VASKLASFESSWLQRVGVIASKGVHYTHHWSRWTETATENRVGRTGSRRHSSLRQPFVSGVVDSSRVTRVLYTLSCKLQYFSNAVINWIQI